MKKLAMLLLTLAGIAGAQTYTIPAGETCTTIEGCSYRNLTATASDGSTLWGLFEAGGYWTQFQYQAFEGQNPGYAAVYCNGTAAWTTAAMDNGDTLYQMHCRATGQPALEASIEAHSHVESYVCYSPKGGSHICTRTVWAVDAGTLTIGSFPQSSSDIVGGIFP
jgi:hypothetical protein